MNQSPSYDVVLFGTEYHAVCNGCGEKSASFYNDYQAINRGSSHSHIPGIGSVFSGIIR